MDSFAYLDTYYMNSEEDYLYIQDHQIYLLYLLEVVYERDVDPTPLGRPLSVISSQNVKFDPKLGQR